MTPHTNILQLIFALVPPPSIWGGWPSFLGLLTTLIGELASMFGCLVGLKDSVTAITFVAVGASLPDLVASRSMAMAKTTADDALDKGGNGVKVFLGLGLPWTIAASYWAAKVYS